MVSCDLNKAFDCFKYLLIIFIKNCESLSLLLHHFRPFHLPVLLFLVSGASWRVRLDRLTKNFQRNQKIYCIGSLRYLRKLRFLAPNIRNFAKPD